MANERLANGPEGGPDYTETNGAAWMPGFTCGGRSPKVEEGEEVVEPFGPEAEQEVSSRAGFTRMLMPGFTCGGRAGKVEGEVVEPFGSEAEEVSSRAGFTRMLSFWKLMGPMILRYKLVRKLPKGDVRDEELERLQGQSARWAECPSSAPAPPQGARVAAGSWQAAPHCLSGGGWPSGHPAIASGARASRLRRRRLQGARLQIQARLHDKYAPLVLQNILGLRGLYVKLGQAIPLP